MEQHNQKFRLRLNLFDAIVLIIALAVGAFVLWNALKPQAAPASTVRYTIRFQGLAEGNGALIQPGDALEDTIQNYALGTVVSVESVPATTQILNQETRQYVQAQIPGCEDVLVTVESPCTISDQYLNLNSGYTIRVGGTAYVRGPGYVGVGPVVSIERLDQEGEA